MATFSQARNFLYCLVTAAEAFDLPHELLGC